MEFSYRGKNRKWMSERMNLEEESQKLLQASNKYVDTIKYWEQKLYGTQDIQTPMDGKVNQ